MKYPSINRNALINNKISYENLSYPNHKSKLLYCSRNKNQKGDKKYKNKYITLINLEDNKNSPMIKSFNLPPKINFYLFTYYLLRNSLTFYFNIRKIP